MLTIIPFRIFCLSISHFKTQRLKLWKNITLLVSHGCETSSLTIRVIAVSENRQLRRIFEQETDYKQYNDGEPHTLRLNQGWDGRDMQHEIVRRNTSREERARTTYAQMRWCSDIDWIHVTQVGDLWWHLAHMLMIFRVP